MGVRDSFVCVEGREGVVYFWFISNKFEFFGRNFVFLFFFRFVYYCVIDYVCYYCVIVIWDMYIYIYIWFENNICVFD